MSDLLTARGLSVYYGHVQALDRVSISIPSGSIVTVIGPNGAGKTTLLSALMGVLPWSGDLLFDGHSLQSASIEERVANGMSYVPEKRELFGEMSVEDNLLLGAFQRYRTGKRDHTDTMNMVYELFPRLRERKKQLAVTLSGGERQMLALGRALMAKPRLLMLDEPSLGLAPLIVKEIFYIIQRLRQTGVSILLVEQNARAALQVADYAYVLETGEITLQGVAKELANDQRVIDSYLGLGSKHQISL